MSMRSNALAYAQQHQPRFLEEFTTYLRIPSISTLPEHRPDIQRAAEWLADEMRRIGLRHVHILPTAGNSVVYGDWLDAPPGAPTLLLYGHYDVQPVDPLDLWEFPPFEARIAGGKIYARGASDNKGQHFSHLKAIEAFLAAQGALPVNVKVCLDGEEEVGSVNLPPFVQAQRDLLAADLVVISDGPMVAEAQPTVIYAMRGIVSFNLRLRGPSRDLHSGGYGGSVYNPAQALAEMLAALHLPDGRVAVPGFYDRVLPLSAEERALLERANYTLAHWQANTGASQPWGELEYTLLERMTARPTCEINGMWGGYQGPGVKTIIPAQVGAKISLRLVPDQNPAEIVALVTDYIQCITPAGIEVELTPQEGAPAAITPYDSPAMQAARQACLQSWGVEAAISRLGGSLPVVATFQQELGAPFVLLPLGLDDNRHSPNEHYRLDYLWRGIQTVVHFYCNLAGVP
jgi:acetylornithine deacetylase/succinyl-diaminopimelate desuccinylase-like protein